jgi:hypothetical protein
MTNEAPSEPREQQGETQAEGPQRPEPGPDRIVPLTETTPPERPGPGPERPAVRGLPPDRQGSRD